MINLILIKVEKVKFKIYKSFIKTKSNKKLIILVKIRYNWKNNWKKLLKIKKKVCKNINLKQII